MDKSSRKHDVSNRDAQAAGCVFAFTDGGTHTKAALFRPTDDFDSDAPDAEPRNFGFSAVPWESILSEDTDDEDDKDDEPANGDPPPFRVSPTLAPFQARPTLSKPLEITVQHAKAAIRVALQDAGLAHVCNLNATRASRAEQLKIVTGVLEDVVRGR